MLAKSQVVGNVVTLATLAIAVAAFLFARRKGRNQAAAAVAAAFASGRASLDAELSAAADARVSVDFRGASFGPSVGHRASEYHDGLDHDDNDVIRSEYVRLQRRLHELDSVRTAGLDHERVGGVLGGVQHGPDPSDPHDGAVAARRAGRGVVPVEAGRELTP